jgi:hypothetical protein
MRTNILFAGATALTLAACGSGGEAVDGEKAEEARGPAVAGLPNGPTPGLWRVSTRISGMPEGMAAPTVETCIREQTFEMPRDPSSQMSGMTCDQQAFRRQGDAMVGHSVCTSDAGVRTETDMRVSGDFSRRYTMAITSTTTPAPTPAMATMNITMTAERLGDCPAASAPQ